MKSELDSRIRLNLPLLDIFVRAEARLSLYRLKQLDISNLIRELMASEVEKQTENAVRVQILWHRFMTQKINFEVIMDKVTDTIKINFHLMVLFGTLKVRLEVSTTKHEAYAI